MSRDSKAGSKTLRLLETLRGFYKPSDEEAWVLAEVAKLNKLYLAYLRAVRGVLEGELLREEARYRWFMRNAVEVVKVLEGIGAKYALYKFRKPFEHVSVDLDILIKVEDISKAVKVLTSRGFRVTVLEPYTATLTRNGFIVDLYTHPSFAWIVYLDGEKLLKCCVEEVELNNVRAKTLTKEAEVMVTATHAIYKEHIVLLIDCLTLWSWISRDVWDLANEFRSTKALEVVTNICKSIKNGFIEAPYKLKHHEIIRAYLEKILKDPVFRETSFNILKYIIKRKDIGVEILSRLTRISY